MKKFLIVLIFVTVITYLLGAFANNSFNTTLWTDKGLIIGGWLGFGLPIVAIAGGIWNGE